MSKIIIVAHDIRSLHNVGSLMRTAEGIGVEKVYLTGYTPHPDFAGDTRLPHIGKRQRTQISKTGLGAEDMISWEYSSDVKQVISDLEHQGYQIAALEQTSDSLPLPEFKPGPKIAIILGREVEGIEPEILDLCDIKLEIPMFGKKESFNVVQAAAMVLYQCRFGIKE